MIFTSRPQIQLYLTRLTPYHPFFLLGIFILSSTLMVWRLGRLEKRGFEGTVLGSLIMPYCSGFPNLIFAYVMGKTGGHGNLVIENCLVNNVTNVTLLLGLPALIWSLRIVPAPASKMPKAQRKRMRLNRLSILLTLSALFFFTGAMWALGQDGRIGFNDGLVLVGIYLFWQVIHVFEVLKTKIGNDQPYGMGLLLDFLIIALCAYGTYISIDQLVVWIKAQPSGFVSFSHLGWISGALMVLPNGFLAFYYAHHQRPDIVYSSQIGDGHICIPMCIGIFALFKPIVIPSAFYPGLNILLIAAAMHFALLLVLGRLPKFGGALLVAAYGYFIYKY